MEKKIKIKILSHSCFPFLSTSSGPPQTEVFPTPSSGRMITIGRQIPASWKQCAVSGVVTAVCVISTKLLAIGKSYTWRHKTRVFQPMSALSIFMMVTLLSTTLFMKLDILDN